MIKQNTPHFQRRARRTMNLLVSRLDHNLALHVIHVSTFEVDNPVAVLGKMTKQSFIGRDANDIVVSNPGCTRSSQHDGEDRR